MLVPLIFLLYINDLPTCIHNRIKLYVDEVLLYSNINLVADCIALQQDLDSLMQWLHCWQMTSNPQKCEFLRITNKNPIMHNYYIMKYLISNTWGLQSIINYFGMKIFKELLIRFSN